MKGKNIQLLKIKASKLTKRMASSSTRPAVSTAIRTLPSALNVSMIFAANMTRFSFEPISNQRHKPLIPASLRLGAGFLRFDLGGDH